MSDKKAKTPAVSSANGKKRKILADLHSGMVLLARFADATEEGHPEQEASGSKRSQEVRRALKTPLPSSKHRWN
jgi:hypothetical protein